MIGDLSGIAFAKALRLQMLFLPWLKLERNNSFAVPGHCVHSLF